MADTVDIGELKPSELIRHALKDLEKVEEDPAYIVDMDEWHAHFPEDETPWTCSVCLAGAVMAKTLGLQRNEHSSPWTLRDNGDICDREMKALLALDFFRVGSFNRGLVEMEAISAGHHVIADHHISYAHSPAEFRANMEQAARQLEARGF